MSEPVSDPNVIAVVDDYRALRSVIAARRREVGFSQLDLDHLAGLTSGHCGKLECGSRSFGDVTLPAVLAVLGLRLAIVKDPNAILRPKPSHTPPHLGDDSGYRGQQRRVAA